MKINNIEYWKCENYQGATYATLPFCRLKGKYAHSNSCMSCEYFKNNVTESKGVCRDLSKAKREKANINSK